MFVISVKTYNIFNVKVFDILTWDLIPEIRHMVHGYLIPHTWSVAHGTWHLTSRVHRFTISVPALKLYAFSFVSYKFRANVFKIKRDTSLVLACSGIGFT